MDNQFNVQDAMEALRTEIQRDRIAITNSLNDGFDRVLDKLENHESRLASVEKSQKLINWSFATAVSAAFTAVAAWLTGK